MILSAGSTGELVIEGQAAIFRNLFDPSQGRQCAEQIMDYPYIDDETGDNRALHKGTRVNLSPDLLKGALPGVVLLQDNIVGQLQMQIEGAQDWAVPRNGFARVAIGHVVEAGGGVKSHQDNERLKRLVAIANLKKRRHFVLVPTLEQGRPYKGTLEEGDVLVLDADARPRHSTQNKTGQTGVTMPIFETPKLSIINVDKTPYKFRVTQNPLIFRSNDTWVRNPESWDVRSARSWTE